MSATDTATLPDFAPIPREALGPALNEQGYYVGRAERNLYYVTDGTYMAAFLTTSDGVVVLDAPPTLGNNIQRAIDEIASANGVSNKVEYLVYSHHHSDHVGAASLFGKDVTRIGHEETRNLLLRDNDPARPPNEETFQDDRTLEIGGERIDLAWRGANHSPDNILIHLPGHDTMMLVDIVNPGWVPIYQSNLSEDIPGYLEAPAIALGYEWTHFIGGHMGRLGTRDDLAVHQQYMADLAESSRNAIDTVDPTPYFVKYGENFWAALKGYLDECAATTAAPVIEKYTGVLAAADVFTEDVAFQVMQSIRLDLGYGAQVHPLMADPAEAEDRRRWLALAVIVTAQFMVVLDIAIVNVALPSIKDDLGFSQESLQWVITAYSIFFGGFLLLGGRLADLLGRRRLFMAGLALFTVSSLLNGLAWSEGSLIAFRSLQGLGAAMLSPAALSILTTTFQEGPERNRALGIWGAVAGSGGAAGVLLGGLLTSAFSWPWIFYVNVPVGVAVIAVSPWLLRESRADLPNRTFDFAGAATITGGLMLLVYGMTRATQHGWGTATTIGLLAGSGVLIASFFLIESRSKAPLLPLRILRLRTLAGSNLSALITTGAVFSMFFLLTLYMQQVLHYSALKTGVAYIGFTVTTVAFSAVSQGLVTRFGVRTVLPVGLTLVTVALVFFARLPVDGHYFRNLFPGFIIGGLGLALTFIPMSIGALTGVRQQDAGIASGLINTTQQIGGAVGVAAATTIATTFTNRYVDSHAGATAFSGPALTHGFQIAFYALAASAAVGALLAAVLIEPQRSEAEPEPEAGGLQVAVASQYTPLCHETSGP